MDLDEMKKAWQENIQLKEQLSLSDKKIKELLKREGKTAIDRLMLYAKIYIILSIPLGLLLCLCSFRFFQAGWPYSLIPLFFLFLCTFIVLPSEIYVYRLLRSIDFSVMSLKEVSSKILKYQQIIRFWELIGIVFFVIYMAIWMFFYYKLIFGDEIIWGFIIYMIAVGLIGLAAIPYLYKKMYYKNINKVKESIEELEEFEQDE
ncbi:hypothetical protein LJC52_05255 [Bacteroidales bacterium OttesenSCG-928-A17]|nr:hypothetical protein [Bacteroidales bacterium OttesenSCG-928-A17]